MLYQLLLPYTGHAVVAGGAVVCYGAADGYLGLLAATMGQWEASAWHFEQALALNTRIGANPWLAHTQYEYAAKPLAHGEAGDREKAVALLNEALAIARGLGMHRLEERITAQIALSETRLQAVQAYPDDLSPREVDVLRLIALGKSNRDIADTLCVSLSTVATHVRHILSKTGAANRTEAAVYAMRQRLLEG
jgi:DNA-binding CsgD family transcriptional regulator